MVLCIGAIHDTIPYATGRRHPVAGTLEEHPMRKALNVLLRAMRAAPEAAVLFEPRYPLTMRGTPSDGSGIPKWNEIMQPPPDYPVMPLLGLTRHEARKVLFVQRRITEAVSDALEALTSDERHHAEATWAGHLLELTTRRSKVLPMEEAWTILDTGG